MIVSAKIAIVKATLSLAVVFSFFSCSNNAAAKEAKEKARLVKEVETFCLGSEKPNDQCKQFLAQLSAIDKPMADSLQLLRNRKVQATITKESINVNEKMKDSSFRADMEKVMKAMKEGGGK